MGTKKNSLTTGAKALVKWMKENKRSQGEVALGIGASRPAVTWWAMGKFRPALMFRQKLETYTHGAVKSEDWLDASERKELRQTKPFKKTA